MSSKPMFEGNKNFDAQLYKKTEAGKNRPLLIKVYRLEYIS